MASQSANFSIESYYSCKGKEKSEPSSDGFDLKFTSNLSWFFVQKTIWKRILALDQLKNERMNFGEYAGVICTEVNVDYRCHAHPPSLGQNKNPMAMVVY